MVAAQDGLCAICGKGETDTFKGKTKRLSVDHDHATGDIRSLLCARCNRGIGMFLDEPRLLRLAAIYLEQHRFKRLKVS